jgi:tetratricopeptide (TPR) repeat protein
MGLATTWAAASSLELAALQWRAMALAADHAVEHARRAGDLVLLEDMRKHRGPARLYGPTPVEEGVKWFENNLTADPHSPAQRGQLEAMRGNADEARRLLRESRERATELGQRLWAAGMLMNAAEIELVAGDEQAALDVALQGVEELDELGERGWLSTVAGYAAEALYRLGRDDEAWQFTERAEDAGAEDDVITQMLIRQVRAKVLARRSDLPEAERLAREAVALSEPTDALENKANALQDLATVLAAAGKTDEALDALAQARVFYEQKGHTVGVARVEKLRSGLKAGSGGGEAADARL